VYNNMPSANFGVGEVFVTVGGNGTSVAATGTTTSPGFKLTSNN
jgi:hypothetical protein